MFLLTKQKQGVANKSFKEPFPNGFFPVTTQPIPPREKHFSRKYSKKLQEVTGRGSSPDFNSAVNLTPVPIRIHQDSRYAYFMTSWERWILKDY